MVRLLILCLVLPACFDDEPPDPVTEYEAIYTIESPVTFDALTLVLPMERKSLTVAPPSTEYVWDDTIANVPDLPASMQVVAYRDGAIVADANQVFTYDYKLTPSGTFTIVLVP